MFDPIDELTSRAIQILEAVIERYLLMGKAVGSRTVVRNYNLDYSSATVRNEMADLTTMGYLRQTHVSSGRIPTDKGVRFYLDRLMQEDQLSFEEIERLRTLHSIHGEDFRATVRNAGRALADITRQAGVVLMPGLRQMPLRHIEFIRLTSQRIMALLVSQGGRFLTRVFEWGENLKQHDLTWASNYLNDRFKGKTMSQIRETVIKEMREEKAEYDRMLARAFGLMESALQQEQLDEEVFIEGRENLVEKPEFAEVENIVKLFRTFEEKSFIVKLLSRALEAPDLMVLLSTETGIEDIPNVAVIMARYGADGPGGGTLGIIGPICMNYPKVIPMVRYTANYVSDILKS
jgi:heat-inducible transcriptional repressor